MSSAPPDKHCWQYALAAGSPSLALSYWPEPAVPFSVTLLGAFLQAPLR